MLVPTDDHIIVTEEEMSQTESGLFVSGGDLMPVAKGTVVAVGPGKWTDYNHVIPIRIHVGDTVHYHKQAAMKVKYGDTQYSIIKANAVIAIEE